MAKENRLRYGSVCSGIGGCAAAWHPLGWETAFFAEIEPFPSAVLKHHYADVPNAGDFTSIEGDEYGSIELLVGGTPCQSFSVAGLRGGLSDDRGNLALEFLRLAGRTRARWVVWENVPGVLSSESGRDFGCILGGLAELGYGFAYRVLDAQYFGVPQRRRRVFVVGHLGDWRAAAAVLFERHSLQGHLAPSRKAGERVAPSLAQSSQSSGGIGMSNQELFSQQGGGLVWPPDVAPTINAHFGSKLGLEDQHIDGGAGMFTMTLGHTESNGLGIYESETANTLEAVSSSNQAIAFSAKDHGADATENLSPTLRAGGFDKSHANSGNWMAVAQPLRGNVYNNSDPAMEAAMHVKHGMAVRRLAPRECERLQGYRDDYTLIPYRGKSAADGPRYKALGNSWAVPVVQWIGKRISFGARY